MDVIPDIAQYEAALAAALTEQPDPPTITGYGIVQSRRLTIGVGEMANGGRGLHAYRVMQFPIRPGLELVAVFPPNAEGRRPDPAPHMAAIERCIDRLRAIDRAAGLKDPFGPTSL
jgi:hypothetical protein